MFMITLWAFTAYNKSKSVKTNKLRAVNCWFFIWASIKMSFRPPLSFLKPISWRWAWLLSVKRCCQPADLSELINMKPSFSYEVNICLCGKIRTMKVTNLSLNKAAQDKAITNTWNPAGERMTTLPERVRRWCSGRQGSRCLRIIEIKGEKLRLKEGKWKEIKRVGLCRGSGWARGWWMLG